VSTGFETVAEVLADRERLAAELAVTQAEFEKRGELWAQDRARLAEAERKLQHCKEQADEGLGVEHDCPAMFACASICAELATEEDIAAAQADSEVKS
jgi:hypothetical protein